MSELETSEHHFSLVSLLAESDNEDDDQNMFTEEDGISTIGKTIEDERAYGPKKDNLTRLQDEIMYAIQSINMHYFVDLGGVVYYDINFDHKSTGGFPLKVAAAKGSPTFVRLMLENKMLDINKKDTEGVNAFWIAARFGHGGVMGVLAENGIDVLNTDSKGYNALHVAAKFKYDNLVKMLVNSKYPLDEQTNDGETAVAIASQRGNFEILKTL